MAGLAVMSGKEPLTEHLRLHRWVESEIGSKCFRHMGDMGSYHSLGYKKGLGADESCNASIIK